MLVDLGRNDIGKIAETGSVHVPVYLTIERYRFLMHLVSVVEGTLKPGLTAMDALRSTLPAGTVSGAPKIRAMERIYEWENVKRGPYAGAVGYLTKMVIRISRFRLEQWYFITEKLMFKLVQELSMIPIQKANT